MHMQSRVHNKNGREKRVIKTKMLGEGWIDLFQGREND